jgi:pyrimidine deaminase RibD-like protein
MEIQPPNEIRKYYMRLAIELAGKSPPKPSNFRVGAVLVDEERNQILSTGYTLELPGNTHAEQCCLQKLAHAHNTQEEDVGNFLPGSTVLYTTMEPCGVRLSGNMPCVDRIIRTRRTKDSGIKSVYHGIKEPDTFVGENKGRRKLEDAGIECCHVPGFEDEILRIATAGHQQEGKKRALHG